MHGNFCEGKIADNGELYDFAFHEPLPNLNLPRNQRHFAFRNEDLEALRFYAPIFRDAMAGNYWKFRMAVQLYDTGHLQWDNPRVRFFLWTSALEALFTSHTSAQHRGSFVAKERIKHHVGAGTSVYPPGELIRLNTNPNLTVADVLDELYCLRNHVAHGDKIPDHYLEQNGRDDVNGTLSRFEMLTENGSYIVRRSLLRIMKENLLSHFADAPSSEAYFDSLGLTKNAIRAARRQLGTPVYQCPS